MSATVPVDLRHGPHDSYLLVLEGASSAFVQLPATGEVVIGRGDAATVRLSDPSTSRAHARITLVGGSAQLADLGSQNGTKVNGELVAGTHALQSGDVIAILGATLVFHRSSRLPTRRQLLSLEAMRARIEDELDRVTRHRRGFALAAIRLATDGRRFDPLGVARDIEPCLRRLDVAALVGNELLVMLPEVDAAAAVEATERVLGMLRGTAPGAIAGLALAPDDGADVDVLLVGARAAREHAETAGARVRIAAEAYRTIELPDQTLLVADPAMLRLMALLDRLARAELPVLVCGETGTGKELAAGVLHAWSQRSTGRLVVLNCAALPETLAESELFGHEKGAFTGAVAQKAGILEQSDGGTVFLDEIGELSLVIQAKLLRALETKRITRVGGNGEVQIDLRIVAATNRDLAAEVAAGRFRQDLLFRLGGATVWLPPLRDRQREIPILASRFLLDACRRADRTPIAIAPDAMQRLLAYSWPGNVRELRQVMDYAAATCDEPMLAAWHLVERLGNEGKHGATTTADEPDEPAAPEATPATFAPIEDEIRELEQRRMAQALAVAGGNQTAAAELIRMPLRTFQAKAKAYGLRQKDRR